jgi:hypothetical protein
MPIRIHKNWKPLSSRLSESTWNKEDMLRKLLFSLTQLETLIRLFMLSRRV